MKSLTIILLAFICLFYSCQQAKQNAPKRSVADSLEIQAKATKMAHDMMQRAKDSAANVPHFRSSGPCPVVIKKCNVVTDVSGSKAIIVTVKNNSSKKIAAIKISWVLYNGNGKQVNNSNGMAKKELAKGKSASYSWAVYPHTGTRAKAIVSSVHYKDGSIWRVD